MIASWALLLVELLVLFVGVSFLVEVLQRRVGPERLRSWMGGRPAIAAVKGIVVGFITPFCTYSAIPLLVGLRRAGVPPAGYVAFISAAPVLDPILFGALMLIVGPTVAVAYFLVTFAAAFSLALLAQHVHVERHLVPIEQLVRNSVDIPANAPVAVTMLLDTGDDPDTEVDVANNACVRPEHSEPWRGWALEARSALGASTTLLRSFGPLLLLGVAVGIAIEAIVSPESAAQLTTGSPWAAIPAAAALGTPLYFSTELFVPIANSLHGAGVGAGAIVALTIAGAGANLPEFIVLSKMAKPAAVSVFCVYVFAVAIGGGAIAHVLAG